LVVLCIALFTAERLSEHFRALLKDGEFLQFGEMFSIGFLRWVGEKDANYWWGRGCRERAG
jgi:hypothetical protein